MTAKGLGRWLPRRRARLRAHAGQLSALLGVLLLIGYVQPAAGAAPANASAPAGATTAALHPAGTAAPIITGTFNLDHALEQTADREIANMTLDDELGQLFLVEFVGPTYSANNAAMVEQMHAGGIILYSANMPTADQTRALIATAQSHASIPLIVTTDEEGGFVDRLQQIYGRRPSASEIGATGSASYARSQGAATGRDMSAVGLNFDLAPDVDVQLVAGPDQVTRTFGTTPGAVTQLAGAYLQGLQSQHIVGCLKHFPGLGDATTDAHKDLPEIDRSRAQIEAVELAPYRALIASGQVQAVMATDLLMPALDSTLPAELSPTIITGVLRDELGFNGVVVTDALYMQGVADRYSEPEAAVMAIEAGDDMLVGPLTPGLMGAMMDALRAAVRSGRISKARIDESVRRILLLKLSMGLLPLAPAAVHELALPILKP